jgi:hypothetical protein
MHLLCSTKKITAFVVWLSKYQTFKAMSHLYVVYGSREFGKSTFAYDKFPKATIFDQYDKHSESMNSKVEECLTKGTEVVLVIQSSTQPTIHFVDCDVTFLHVNFVSKNQH